MPLYPKPWYRESTGSWMAQIDRKQVKLFEGLQPMQCGSVLWHSSATCSGSRS